MSDPTSHKDLDRWKSERRWDLLFRWSVGVGVVLLLCAVTVLLIQVWKQDGAIKGLSNLSDAQGEAVDTLCEDKPNDPTCEEAQKLPDSDEVVREVPGPRGFPGMPGQDGQDGQDGADGKPGPRGPPGPEGALGTAGPTGARGIPGPAGADGQDGTDGLPGTPGEKGDKGDPGLDGKDGSAGADGRDGVSITGGTAECIEGEPLPGDDIVRFTFTRSQGEPIVIELPMDCG